MKTFYTILGFFILNLLCPTVQFAQGFIKSIDTIDSDVKEGLYTAKFMIPKASLALTSKITFSINTTNTDVAGFEPEGINSIIAYRP